MIIGKKKAMILVIAFFAAICLTLGGLLFRVPARVNAAESDRITFSSDEKSFSSFDDFTYDAQGNRGWYYMYGQPAQPDTWEESQSTITYDMQYWRGGNAYTLIGKGAGATEIKYLAGEVNETAVHAWKAPVSGTVNITVQARNGGSCPFDGDVWLAGTQIEDGWALQSGAETKEYSAQAVSAGDFFYFTITQTSGTVAGGEVYAVITIEYTAVADDAVQSLEAAIDALPAADAVQAENIEAILAAYEQAAGMDAVQRAFVDSQKAEKLLAVYSKALVLDAQAKIELIPAVDEMTTETMESDKVLIDSARKAYDILTAEEQASVSNSADLVAAEEKYAGLLIAAELSPLIAAIPDEVTSANKETVLIALDKYNSLTAEQQGYVSEADLAKLTKAVNVIAELEKESTMVFNSAYGFSSVQGENNWYYEYRSGNAFHLMTTYNSGEQAHNGGSAYSFVYNSGIHPDVSDPVRKFVAPYDGVINVSGWGYKTGGGCDIELTVLQNDTDLFASDPIETITGNTSISQRVEFEATGISVEKGDEIRFVYHAPNGNTYGETRSVVEIEYVEAIDSTLSIAHQYTFDADIPSEMEIGDSIHLSGQVVPADSTEQVKYVIAYMENAYSAKNSTPLDASDAYIDEGNDFRALLAGQYAVLAIGSETGAVIGQKNINVVQSTSGRVNNSYYDYDASLTVNPQSGQGNWYFMNYEVSSGDFTECVSTFQDTYYQGALTYVLMARQENILHDTSNYPTRAWKAPVAGQVEFTVVARVVAGPQMEVMVCVNSDDDVRVSDWVVNTKIAQGRTVTVDVEAGDMIYVVIKEAGGGTGGSSFYTTMTAKYNSVQSDAVQAFETMVSALPETVTLENEQAVTAAEEAYDGLSDLEKSFVTEASLQKLQGAQDSIAALKVSAMIDALPAISELTEENAASVDAAFTAYEALTEAQQALVANYGDLLAADDRLAAIPVENMIAALPSVDALTLADADEVDAARSAYLLLTEAQQAYVNNVTVLENAEAKIEQLQADAAAVAAVEDKIDSIPATVTKNDVAVVESAQAAYAQLEESLQAMVNPEKVAKLNAAIATLNAIEDAEEVVALIDALPANVTLANEDAVEAAETAYSALSSEAKTYVTNYAKLQAARQRIDELNKGVEVSERIDQLPSEISLADKETVAAIREAYDALSNDAKTYVENYSKLTAAEAAIADLEDRAAAENVADMIDALPATISLNDKQAVENARAAYDQLTAAQKELVANYSKLTDAEATIAALENNDSDGNGGEGEDQGDEKGGCGSFIGGVSGLFGGVVSLVGVALFLKKRH